MDTTKYRGLLQKTEITHLVFLFLMLMSAEFYDNAFLVRKPRDAGLLHSKSQFGKPLSGNQLQLDILEAVFLVGEGKLQVFQKKKEMDFQSLVQIATEMIPGFELQYLVFRDLRKRGYPVKRFETVQGIHFFIGEQKKVKNGADKPRFIRVFSERETITIDDMKKLVELVRKKNGELWFIIVDEEGDITYYDVDFVDLKGETSTSVFPKGRGVLLENRIVVFDKKLSTLLKEKEFFGKPFGEGLQLSLVEALFLVKRGVLEIHKIKGEKKLSLEEFQNIVEQCQADIVSRLLVFTDLKHRGLMVKTGFKFGTHFRAYTKNPEKTHAEYLVHVVKKGYGSIWAEVSRAVRLAHSVNKDFVFARVDGEHLDYIRFGRLRP